MKKIIGLAAMIGMIGASQAGAVILETVTSTVDSTTMGLKIPGGDAAALMNKFSQNGVGGSLTDYQPTATTILYDEVNDITLADGVTVIPARIGVPITMASGAFTNNPTGCVTDAPDDGLLQNAHTDPIATPNGDPLGCGYHSASSQTAPTTMTLNLQGQPTNTATGVITSSVPYAITVGTINTGDYLKITGVNEVTIDPQAEVMQAETGIGDGEFYSRVTKLNNTLTQDMDLWSTDPVTLVTAIGRQHFKIESSIGNLPGNDPAFYSFWAGISGDSISNLGFGQTSKAFTFNMDIDQEVEIVNPIDQAYDPDGGDQFVYDTLANPFEVLGGSATNLPLDYEGLPNHFPVKPLPPGFQ